MIRCFCIMQHNAFLKRTHEDSHSKGKLLLTETITSSLSKLRGQGFGELNGLVLDFQTSDINEISSNITGSGTAVTV